MGLPESLRVKISSEDAGVVSLTPVVARDMPLRELVELMLGAAGKDAARVRELLLRGSFVSGASRFRWQGFDAEPAAIEALLRTFPEDEPGRAFSQRSCVRAVLRGPAAVIRLEREVAGARRFLRRRTFWDVLMEIVEAGEPQYVGYSHKEQADHYTVALPPETAARLREAAGAILYSSLEAQVRRAQLERLELYVERLPARNEAL